MKKPGHEADADDHVQGVQAGQILAAGVFIPLSTFMSDEAFLSYGWRIPFVLSVFVIVAGVITPSP